MPVYNITIELPLEMTALYAGAETLREVEQLFLEFGATIDMANTNDWEVSDDPEYFDAGTANKMMQMNLELYRAALDRVRGTNEWTPKSDVASTPSHTEVIVESSNTTTTTQEPKDMTTQAPITNSTINIESMTLTQLAELQVAVAARMQELINAPATQIEEVVAPQDVEPIKPNKAASRVKKSKVGDAAPKAKPDMAKVEQVAKQVEKNDEQVRKAIAAKAEAQVAAPTSDVSTMKYAELRSFISAATKSSAKAKEHAQSIARKYGAKSWATVGRSGYEQIYKLINA